MKEINKWWDLEMTINKPVEEMFKDSVFVLLEIEIMQGERVVLEDGQIRYRVNLSKEKGQIIKEAMLKSIHKQHYNAN